jgi:hypothetical protein
MTRQRIWIVNAALLLLFIWGAMRLRSDWNAFGATHQASRLQNAAPRNNAKARVAESAPVAAEAAPWTEIAARSPFSFDRNDMNLDLTEAVAAPVAGPKPFLLATLILGNEKIALMGKPGGDSRSSTRVKVGQTFEGWEVVEIQDSSVVITSNGAKESITVGRAPVARSTEKTSAQPTAPPVANSVAPPPPVNTSRPAPASSGSNGILGLGSRGPRPDVPPGSRAVEGPFGWRIERIEQDSK